MPEFNKLPLHEAVRRAASSAQAKVRAEYLGYIEALGPGEAGRLQINAGEQLGVVRTRLSTAARLAGISLIIRRAGSELLFWVNPPAETADGDVTDEAVVDTASPAA